MRIRLLLLAARLVDVLQGRRRRRPLTLAELEQAMKRRPDRPSEVSP